MQIKDTKSSDLKLTPEEMSNIDFNLVYSPEIANGLSLLFKAISEDYTYFKIDKKIGVSILHSLKSIEVGFDKFYPNLRSPYEFLFDLNFNELEDIKKQSDANILLSAKIDEKVIEKIIHPVKEVSIDSVYGIFSQMDYLENLFGIKDFFIQSKKHNFNPTLTSGTPNIAKFDNYSLHYFFDGDFRCTFRSHYFNIHFAKTHFEINFNVGDRTLKIYNNDNLEIITQLVLLMFKLSTGIECSTVGEILHLDTILSI
jgi:hypothetical protein